MDVKRRLTELYIIIINLTVKQICLVSADRFVICYIFTSAAPELQDRGRTIVL